MAMELIDAIREYKAAKNSDILSPQQKEKEKNMALGKGVLSITDQIDAAPTMLAAAFGVSSATVGVTGEAGYMVAGAMVVAKSISILARKPQFVNAYKNRQFFEEKAALSLSSDPKNDHLIRKTNTLSTSLEMLIGYNRAINSAKRHDSYEGFMKWGKQKVVNAFAFAEDTLMESLETKDEKSWLKRFLTKPVDKLVPQPIKNYLENMKDKKKLLDWIEGRYDYFEKTSHYKTYLERDERELFGSYKVFQQDMEQTFEEAYKEVLSCSIKDKFVEMVDDYFTLANRVRNTDILKKLFEEQGYKERFEQMAELYDNTKDDKYAIFSILAKKTLNDVENGEVKHIAGWNHRNQDTTNYKIITRWLDHIAQRQGCPRIVNVGKSNEPLLTIFNKKLDAIMETRIDENLSKKEVEQKIEESTFEHIEFNSDELEEYRKARLKHHREGYMKTHGDESKNNVHGRKSVPEDFFKRKA